MPWSRHALQPDPRRQPSTHTPAGAETLEATAQPLHALQTFGVDVTRTGQAHWYRVRQLSLVGSLPMAVPLRCGAVQFEVSELCVHPELGAARSLRSCLHNRHMHTAMLLTAPVTCRGFAKMTSKAWSQQRSQVQGSFICTCPCLICMLRQRQAAEDEGLSPLVVRKTAPTARVITPIKAYRSTSLRAHLVRL